VKNLILYGGIFHPFEKSSEALADQFRQLGIESELSIDIEASLEQLENGFYNLLTVNALRWKMEAEKYDPYRDEWRFSLSDAGRKIIDDFVSGGGGLIGLHTASICFDDWPAWSSILGAKWDWGHSFHPPLGPVDVVINKQVHPLTKNLADFSIEHDEIYHHLKMEENVTGLLSAEASDEHGSQPLLWARDYGKGRVVYDALGHDENSINHPVHSIILKRAARWALAYADEEVEAIQ
jgi:type 1 glutamine amidotransferase